MSAGQIESLPRSLVRLSLGFDTTPTDCTTSVDLLLWLASNVALGPATDCSASALAAVQGRVGVSDRGSATDLHVCYTPSPMSMCT